MERAVRPTAPPDKGPVRRTERRDLSGLVAHDLPTTPTPNVSSSRSASRSAAHLSRPAFQTWHASMSGLTWAWAQNPRERIGLGWLDRIRLHRVVSCRVVFGAGVWVPTVGCAPHVADTHTPDRTRTRTRTRIRPRLCPRDWSRTRWRTRGLVRGQPLLMVDPAPYCSTQGSSIPALLGRRLAFENLTPDRSISRCPRARLSVRQSALYAYDDVGEWTE